MCCAQRAWALLAAQPHRINEGVVECNLRSGSEGEFVIRGHPAS